MMRFVILNYRRTSTLRGNVLSVFKGLSRQEKNEDPELSKPAAVEYEVEMYVFHVQQF
jgi:hypothetical protein